MKKDVGKKNNSKEEVKKYRKKRNESGENEK